jgi:hypothetical protein
MSGGSLVILLLQLLSMDTGLVAAVRLGPDHGGRVPETQAARP